jgi:hypothetical protein
MRVLFFLFLALITLSRVSAQSSTFNITKLDSSENFYSKIQSEIRNKNIGDFTDTVFDAAGYPHVLIKYSNFVSKYSEGAIWTIVNKYEFNQNRGVEKIEHWKTDNINKICKCGNWQYKTKGIWSLQRPYPNCKKKEFTCDSTGAPAKAN